MTAVLFEAVALAKHYGTAEGRVDALQGVDFTIADGEFVSITGPSGSGKSTLLGLLGLLARPTSGGLWFRGRSVLELSNRESAAIRRTEIGFVFQSFQLLDRTSALENVELPLVYSNVPPRERHKRAHAALERVGLGLRLSHEPVALSGGEQQRVAIARAIVARPRVILADEPTGALDTRTGQDILDTLTDLNRSGTTVIVITHNADIAASAGRQLQLVDGHLHPPEPGARM
jgi:putative ABC transport system ATP-binding protein